MRNPAAGIRRRIDKFSSAYFTYTASASAADAYLALMAICYALVIALIALGSELAVGVAIATGFTDVALHAARRVTTRLPASIPLGIGGAAALGLMAMWGA